MMRKILIILLTLCVHSVYSQTTDTSTYAKKMDYLLQNIPKPSNGNILYNRAFPFAELTRFGEIDYNSSSVAHWKQAYYELQIASNQLNHKLLISPQFS